MYIIEDNITEINYLSKEKNAKFTDICSKISFTKVVGCNITPNQSDINMYLEKHFKQGYLKKYNNIINDKKILNIII